MPNVKVRGISRSFGNNLVLDDVSFSVPHGALTGFVGGNGAGKTTTMRIILGVLAAHGGDVTLDGQPLDADARFGFGYMPEERGLYPKMKVAEQLTYLARLHGFDRSAADRNARELLGRLGLAERADEPLESLSLGNQQRVQIAAALVHEPQVLILDEPFSGLDPLAIEVVLSVLTEYAERGAPVLFSSHQLDLVERLCDHLVIIAGGRIRAEGTRTALQDQFGVARHRIVVDGDAGWLRSVPELTVTEFERGTAVFEATDATAQQVLTRALSLGPVTSFGPVRPSLSEIFKDVVTDAEAAA